MDNRKILANKSSDLFKSLCVKLYYCGIPHLWTEKFESSVLFSYFQTFLTVFIAIFILSEWYSFWTQTNLSEKQKLDRIVFSFSHPILFSYHISTTYHQKKIKKILYKIAVILKQDYNNPEVDTSFVKKTVFYSIVCSLSIATALVSYGFDGLVQIIQTGNPFL